MPLYRVFLQDYNEEPTLDTLIEIDNDDDFADVQKLLETARGLGELGDDMADISIVTTDDLTSVKFSIHAYIDAFDFTKRFEYDTTKQK